MPLPDTFFFYLHHVVFLISHIYTGIILLHTVATLSHCVDFLFVCAYFICFCLCVLLSHVIISHDKCLTHDRRKCHSDLALLPNSSVTEESVTWMFFYL